MKTITVIILAMAVVTASASAQVGGVEYKMKEKARGFRTNAVTRGQDPAYPSAAPAKTTAKANTAKATTARTTTARSAAPPAAAPAAATPAPVAPKPVEKEKPAEQPKLTEAQTAAAKKLENDLDAIKPNTAATPDQTQKLMRDLLNAARGNQPGMTSMMNLAGDLSAGWPAQTLRDRDKEQFCQSVVLLLNCGELPAADTRSTVQHSELLLKNSGMPNGDAQRILGSLKSIVTQLQK